MPLPADILRPHLSAVTYTPVKPLDVLALEIGIPEAQLIKLDANENLYGPLPSVRSAMDGADMHIYPDPSQHKLKQALSQLHLCSPDSLVVGAGSDEVCIFVSELILSCAFKLCLGLRAGYQDCAMQRSYLLQPNIWHVQVSVQCAQRPLCRRCDRALPQPHPEQNSRSSPVALASSRAHCAFL